MQEDKVIEIRMEEENIVGIIRKKKKIKIKIFMTKVR